jgi:RNA polymerase sigma factor (sigma-70 family)
MNNFPTEFEQKIVPHLDAAYGVARRLVRDATIADDVVQEAFLRALKYFAPSRIGLERPWLFRIVRNVAFSRLSAEERRSEQSFGAQLSEAEEEFAIANTPDPRPGPEAILMAREKLDQVDKALSALPAALRECLLLRESEDLSYKEIAEMTGVAIGTVMSRLWRARRALQIVEQQT